MVVVYAAIAVLAYRISWPHFDLGSIVAAAAGAVVGWLAKLIEQNRRK